MWPNSGKRHLLCMAEDPSLLQGQGYQGTHECETKVTVRRKESRATHREHQVVLHALGCRLL